MATQRGMAAYTRALAKAKMDFEEACEKRDQYQERVDQSEAIMKGLELFLEMSAPPSIRTPAASAASQSGI